jgi:hypothetical protein
LPEDVNERRERDIIAAAELKGREIFENEDWLLSIRAAFEMEG